MSEIETLSRKRGVVKAALTRFTNYVNILGPDDDLRELRTRFTRAQCLLEDYNDVQTQIEMLDAETNYERERVEFERNFYAISARVEGMLATSISVGRPVGAGSDATGAEQQLGIENVRLPILNLPVFGGDYEDWAGFKDTFNALVNENPRLSNIQRFYYLRSNLKGKAAETVASLQVSNDNYAVAWNLLIDRFENKKLTIYIHVRSIVELPNLRREDAVELRNLLDIYLKNYRALKVLGEPVEMWGTLLIYIITSKFDANTRKHWEMETNSKTLPTLDKLESFMKERCRLLETIGNKNKIDLVHKKHAKFATSNVAHTANRFVCYICKGNHSIYNCSDFIDMPIKNRIREVRNKRLCLNCLKPGHFVRDCRANTCNKCSDRHNVLLHLPSTRSPADRSMPNAAGVQRIADAPLCTRNEPAEPLIANHTTQTENKNIHVLLSTAIVQVVNDAGEVYECRALLDSGSQAHFVSEALCKRLKMTRNSVHYSVTGIGRSLTNIAYSANVNLQSRSGSFQKLISCLVIPKITENLPCISFDSSKLKIPKRLTLADPTFAVSGPIDLLLGATIFWELTCVGQVRLGEHLPILQNTRLGWIIAGPTPTELSSSNTVSTNCAIEGQLKKFWEIEEAFRGPQILQSPSELFCENYFKENTVQNSLGRFVVTLPCNDVLEKLGDSRQTALKRFLSIEKKLDKNERLKRDYHDFIHEYINLGHMSETLCNTYDSPEYFMPHHAVFKADSSTTRVRVVFDASAKTSTDYSLNDAQIVGPTIQDDLVSILLRFRKHAFVLTGDIAKMYRQVLVNPRQRSLQQIYWRFRTSDPISVYQLNTITYGTAAASFQAIRAMHQTAYNNRDRKAVGANTILRDFYVDDLITGANSIDELLATAKDVIEILESGCFNLRKLVSNNIRITREFAEGHEASNHLDFGHRETYSKTLGLIWLPNSDLLKYNFTLDESSTISKRNILSETARIFDPLGLLGPITVVAKIIMQELWQQNISWDEPVPSAVYTKWVQFRQQLESLSDIMIPRHALCLNPLKVELHGFADASEKAYAACVYFRSMDSIGHYSVRLLISKNRVAPLKVITIPRLELCAALLLCQLVERIKTSTRMNFDEIFYWSDSSIVLAWIQNHPNKFKPFVSHRISEIQNLSSGGRWQHVSGSDNPADVLSRGCSVRQLINFESWWNGPSWLTSNSELWPSQDKHLVVSKELPETKNNAVVTATVARQFSLFTKYSSLTKLQTVFAYCLRWISNIKPRLDRTFGTLAPLTTAELNHALRSLVKVAQREAFAPEVKALATGAALGSRSGLSRLNPFIDGEGLIRVGGRLSASDFHEDKKHPMILPARHPLSNLIARFEHIRLLHAGPQLLLSSIRERFWPINGRNLVRKIVHNCVTCFRCNPTPTKHVMGDLPRSRITPARPFYVSGVDYAGPISIKNKTGRGVRVSKSYICLFVCFATRAIHLELVGDLTTEAFMGALRRFTSRRGKCKTLYSDNATTFVGANAELASFLKLNERIFPNLLTAEGIEWKFIPPRSPHFGGLWEAGIKSAKFHLKRVIGNALLTYEQLLTVLIQIEACLNSRPLSPLSNDPNDLNPLTPAHFLIGESLTTLPEPNLLDIKENRLSKYQRLQQILQSFWSRWAKEYVSEMQVRVKWKRICLEGLEVGRLVLIKEDNIPPLKWSVGRVLETHPGSDGVVRVATIKTASGVYKRAVTKLCAFPADTTMDDNV